MPVPTSLASLSTTPGSNPPGGAENPFPELDDHLRQMYAFAAQLRDQKAPLNNPAFTGSVSLPASTTAVGDGTEFTGVYLKSGRSGGSLHTEFVDGRHANNIPHSSVSMVANTDGSSSVDVRVTSAGSASSDRRALKFRVTDADGPVRFDDAATANGLVRKSQLDSAVSAATTTARGTVELADETEARALTNATNALTPATLAAALTGSNQSLSASGFQRLPGGLILQWGEVTTSTSGDVSVTFTPAFPTACVSVIGTGTQPINASVFVAASQTATGFTATCWYTSSSGGTLRGSGVYRWIALGY